jgi:hypothetical protein
MARRYKSLHFNLREGENIVFHREHRSKNGRHQRKPTSLEFLRYKFKKKYGKDAKYLKIPKIKTKNTCILN